MKAYIIDHKRTQDMPHYTNNLPFNTSEAAEVKERKDNERLDISVVFCFKVILDVYFNGSFTV